jgi:hypothetical protein
VAPASDASKHGESHIGDKLSGRCGYYSGGGHAYYTNCDAFIGHWIEWLIRVAEGDIHQAASVSRSTTLPLGPADEVEFLVSVGNSSKFLLE